MKYIKLLILLFVAVQANAQSDFYYYKESKIPLKVNNQFAYLLTNMQSKDELQKKLNGIATITKFHPDNYQNRLITTYRNSSEKIAGSDNNYAEIKFNNSNLDFDQVKKIITQLKTMPEIIHISFSYNNMSNERVSITNYIWVGMKDEQQIATLIAEAKKINYSVVGQNPFMPEFVMLCPNENSNLSQMAAAQKLYETRLFSSVEPELIG